MKHQSKTYTCGVASVVNALECMLVTKYTQGAIRNMCHTSPEDGTDEVEIKRALLATVTQVDEYQVNDRPTALHWLTETLIYRGPAILCVDNESHWVTVTGRCGPNFLVFDPALGEGDKVYSPKGLATRWRAATKPHYYGIGCAK